VVNDAAGSIVGLLFGLCFDLAHHLVGLVPDLDFDIGHQHANRFVARHAGYPLQLVTLFLDQLVDFGPMLFDLVFPLVQCSLALLQAVHALVEVLFLLLNAALLALHLGAPFAPRLPPLQSGSDALRPLLPGRSLFAEPALPPAGGRHQPL